MSQMGPVNDGISGSAEWQLLQTIRRNSGRFRTGPLEKCKVKKNTLELRNAIDNLSVTIIETFTALDLDILIQADGELRSQEPKSKEEDKSGANSNLQNLCSFLEPRVNTALISNRHTTCTWPRKTSICYPKLALLAEHVESCVSDNDRLELIPIPGTHETPFLFNIGNDTDMTAAFDDFRNPKLERPRGKTRKMMLAETQDMRDFLQKFNRFVKQFRDSVASLDLLAEPLRQQSTTPKIPVSFNSLQTFRQQASATFRAVISQFSKCLAHSSSVHAVFLQLPGITDVFNCTLPGAEKKVPVQLIIKGCQHDDWHPADSYFLPPENSHDYKQQAVCKALEYAQNDGRDLELYVLESLEPNGNNNITLHVPHNPRQWQRRKCFELPPESLLDLVKNNHFERCTTAKLLLKTNYKGEVFRPEQRRLLALKVILGFMLSMDSEQSICTWRPEQVHSFHSSNVPQDDDLSVFVSVVSSLKEQGDIMQRQLSLSDWDFSIRGGDEYDLPPLSPFTLLSKFFLQIAGVGVLEDIEIFGDPKQDRDARNNLRKLIEIFMGKVSDGDLEIAPFLEAALQCLNFHMTVQKYARETKFKDLLTLAWKLVFDHIISKIDNTFVLEDDANDGTAKIETKDAGEEKPPEIMKAGAALELEHPDTAIHEVALFDGEPAGEDSLDVRQARKFFDLMENFHESYSRDATAWDKLGTKSHRRVRVAVLDTGIDFGLPEIQAAEANGRIKREWCHSMVGDGGSFEDEDPGLHGTNCVLLLHKAAPEADIYVVKVSVGTDMRTYQTENIAKAINHVVKTWDVDIISMSFGLRQPPAREDENKVEEGKAKDKHLEIVDGMKAAIRKASAQAILFAAASNDGRNGKRSFPASYDPHVICVNASTGDGSESRINPDPVKDTFNFMTLGVGVEMTVKKRGGNAYHTVYRSGTSFATPIAAGIAATVLDLAMRVEAVNNRTERELRNQSGMRQFLRKMASLSREASLRTGFYYLAPWRFWEQDWQADEVKRRVAWDSMNSLFWE